MACITTNYTAPFTISLCGSHNIGHAHTSRQQTHCSSSSSTEHRKVCIGPFRRARATTAFGHTFRGRGRSSPGYISLSRSVVRRLPLTTLSSEVVHVSPLAASSSSVRASTERLLPLPAACDLRKLVSRLEGGTIFTWDSGRLDAHSFTCAICMHHRTSTQKAHEPTTMATMYLETSTGCGGATSGGDGTATIVVLRQWRQ